MIFIGRFLQKSLEISGSFSEKSCHIRYSLRLHHIVRKIHREWERERERERKREKERDRESTRENASESYRVSKTHRMPEVAGHFLQKRLFGGK